MKIAVPTRGTDVDNHFGHCEVYTIFHTDGSGRITNSELLPSPQGCGCKSNIASILKEHGVEIMLAGNMGDGALNVLTRHGIGVIRGCSGNVQLVTETYLQGKLTDSGVGCEHHHHHAEGHSCNH